MNSQGNKSSDQEDSPRSDGLASALWSVKNLVSIVMGLALTHTVVTLLTRESDPELSRHTHSLLALSEISPQAALSALALITAIIRFHHGNNQLLDLFYGDRFQPKEEADSNGGIGGNFIVIMVQSVFFALMSFYVNGSRQLMLLFVLLLLLDILWYVANRTTTDADPAALRVQRNWMINNLVFLAVLAGLYYTKNDGWAVTAAAGAILLNTIVDFKISWTTYFPRLAPKPERRLRPVP